MKLREVLVGTAIVSFFFISANAKVPIPSPLITEDKILGSAYYDTLNILSAPNGCSDFFGGSSDAVDIFNDLISNVSKESFSTSIGIRMSGGLTNVVNMRTKSKYRLFDKVSINADGPFYRRIHSSSQRLAPGIGSYQGDTKEARVLMLLHELGHVVEGERGGWLLPDDGEDEGKSRANTRRIEDVCGEQIKSLGKGDTEMSSASGKQKQPDESLNKVDTQP